MKVAFLIAYDRESPYQWSLPPLGIGYLSSYAKKHAWYLETTFDHRVESLVERRPDVVAISSSTENFRQAEQDARAVKDALGVPVILGGMHITALPRTLPAAFDVACVGEGERTFLELVRLFHVKKRPDPADYAKIPGVVYHDNGARVLSPEREAIQDLDTLPYPDRELIHAGWGLAPTDEIHLMSSRGCPYRCAFCASAKHWKTFRFFSADYVADEIEFLRNRYDPEVLYFFDDLFIGHLGRWREVVRLFRERGLHKGVRFRAYARVDLVTEQMAEEFQELNFKYIDFGFESNSEKVLKYLVKTHASPEINQRAVDRLHRADLSIGANFIVGSPPETTEDLEETYRFVQRNKDAFDRCSFGPLQPVPGTPVWREALERGLVAEDMEWSRLAYSHETFDIERFPFLGQAVAKEDFLAFCERFHPLATEINHIGQIRRLAEIRDRQKHEIQCLRDEIARLQGSRLVKAALRLRDWRRTRLDTAPKRASA